MTLSDVRQQIVNHLQELSADQVKALVLQWLSNSDGDLEAFEQQLTNGDLEFGEIDADLNFRALTEAEMIQNSLDALAEYQQTGQSTPHDQVREWASRLGTQAEKNLC